MLLETMLGIANKPSFVREVRRLLRPGGCFALTLEAGEPLTPAEASALPGGAAIWFTPEANFRALLADAGLRVRWTSDLTAAHAARTRRLVATYEGARGEIVAAMGATFWSEIVAQHRAFAAWMETGRLRKVAIVAEHDR
jgi:hypothetical protein